MKPDTLLVATAIGVAAVLVLTTTRRASAGGRSSTPIADSIVDLQAYGGGVSSPYSPFQFVGIDGGVGSMFSGAVSWN